MNVFLSIIHGIASITLILAVLLQSGRGGGIGAALGGASTQIFGGRGASGFLARVTTAAAVVFLSTSLGLSIISAEQRSVLATKPAATAPAQTQDDASANNANTEAEAATNNDAPAEAAPDTP